MKPILSAVPVSGTVGLDLPLNQRFAVRVLQADYQMATFANGSNNRQNNLLLSAGVVAHWGRPR